MILEIILSSFIVGKYVSEFNAADNESYRNSIANSEAAAFLEKNIPLFECPDKELEKTYYFRWWTFRKHIRETADGYVVTEFLPDVPWARKHNTISCPASHHIREGRWLHDKQIATDYMKFWFNGGDPRRYSFPAADATLQLYKVTLDRELLASLYEPLCRNWQEWADSHRDSTGLFWQTDNRDGMEVSVSGLLSPDHSGYRPTINAYCYADADALCRIARILGKEDDASKWKEEASAIKKLTDKYLWDEKDKFYKVVPRYGGMVPSPTRELLGYVPWMYNMADKDKCTAWKQVLDTTGFKAPYGPTTTERRDPGFKLAYEGHECQWNGPSWPFATSQTLTALAESIRSYGESSITVNDYYDLLCTYSDSHRISGNDGNRDRCWIDENLNPFTGEWIARTVLKSYGDKIPDRGKDYNHSTFCDLVISVLVGVEPKEDGTIHIRPLIPKGKWNWFRLENLYCQGKKIDILFDRDGTHYGIGKGLNIYVNGQPIAHKKDYYNAKITIR